VLVGHGPISPDLDEQMLRIAGRVTRWTVVHWIAAAGLSLYAATGLIVLTAPSRLGGSAGWAMRRDTSASS
jgi:hypothetical protein